jgi:gliding motility-associated-like protein
MRSLFFFLFSIVITTVHCWAETTVFDFFGCDSVKIQSKKSLPLCEGDSTELSVLPKNKNTIYRWQRDGIDLNINISVLRIVKKSGLYKITATDSLMTSCVVQDSIKIVVLPRPTINLIATGPANICANDSLKLTATKHANYDYLWLLNDSPLVEGVESDLRPQKTGIYAVIITDTTTKCSSRSINLPITVRPVPVVTLDSIPPICNSETLALVLNGQPTGGLYSGRGVVGNKFVTLNLPVDKYVISYSFTNPEGCASHASRTVAIAPPPRVQVPRQLVILKGESIEIQTTLPSQAMAVWSPSLGLSDAFSTSPVANPERTTTYQVKITTKEGCHLLDELKIIVVDLQIPNGFTPNDDGTNDNWEIDGIGTYPNCVVEVYNRWGAQVFRSQGYAEQWAGKNEGQKQLDVGVYYYSIYLREINYKLSGEVFIIK